jgi:hypothetical protein
MQEKHIPLQWSFCHAYIYKRSKRMSIQVSSGEISGQIGAAEHIIY